jgi:glycosyltransferase involved in cell wall biosynthesis
MRILQVAPLWERVPPPAYGGTEAVVSVLTDGLVRAGHKVVLCASGDSLSLAPISSVSPHSLRNARGIKDGTPYDWVHAAEAIQVSRDFDVVHNHAGEPVLALAGLTETPMLTTMHCLITPDTRIVWDRYAGHYNTVSRAQLRAFPALERARYAGAVHNAIDVASFPFRDVKGDYLLCLNRIAPEKGTHLAVEVARKTGRKLIIAGKVDRVDRDYYEGAVAPLVDGRQVVYVGEADSAMKRDLYSRAACLLNPICWEEPFGLVPVEAMACGTAVIAFSRGAMPEVVVDGETGFLVNDVESMVAAVERIDSIEPARCRSHAETNFDVPVMVGRYLSLYQDIVGPPTHLRERPPLEPVPTFYSKDEESAETATV